MGNYSEVVFWKQVHKGKFWKLDFDRQRIIGNYIVDFYIKSLGVVIEIDGELHNEQLEYDTKRDKYLESLGLKIIRFTNLCVLYDLGNVITTLEEFIISNYRVL
jgi:very-short-patch-repair endonuclease